MVDIVKAMIYWVFKFKHFIFGAGEMGQLVSMLALKAENQSSDPRTHRKRLACSMSAPPGRWDAGRGVHRSLQTS